MAGFYETQLFIFTTVCIIALLAERQVSRSKTHAKHSAEDKLESGKPGLTNAVSLLSRQYLLVYGIVMGADWLQGPYVYSLYREQYGLQERMLAVLFVTGFLSGGLTAPLVGVWADQHGRKNTCLAFCITYASACLCIMVPWMPVLFLGRVLGGLSTSILYSAFETWLVSSANSLALPKSDLSSIFGRATLVNGFVATAAGIVSDELVSTSSNFASPFIASGVLLVVGFAVIRSTWTENYGAGGGTADSDVFQIRRLKQAWAIVRGDSRLLVIGLTQTCFEGSMYIFVFLWVPALQEASNSYPYEALPLGYIFSAYMVAMMLGSLGYTTIVSHILPPNTSSLSDSNLTLHAKLSSLVCAFSALALGTSVSSSDEKVRFWMFCFFEACVGMYYPVQGMLRGTLISDENRATLSSLFRVPLNIFVVVSLLTGVSSARYAVLTACSLMLGLSSLLTGAVIVARSDEQTTERI